MITQWDTVEAQFASTYGLTLREIFDLSWRRFRVLFNGIFTWPDKDEEAPKRIADTIDWSQARHTSVSDLSTSSFPGSRVAVGRKNDA